MDQNGHIVDQKGLKLYEKGQKIGFLDLKCLFLAELCFAELGKIPLPKTLSEIWGYPTP